MLRVRVLGAAAGGGFPQWNCACAGCTRARAGDPLASPRTQDSIAVSADGESWVLLNASPDVLRQVAVSPFLWPKAPRHSPIVAVALCNGDVDHVAGLLSLRERQPIELLATRSVLADLFERNVLMRTLQRFPAQLVRRVLPLDEAVEVAGLSIVARAVPGKRPPHLTGETHPEDNVALEVSAHGRRVLYAPAVASLDLPLDHDLVMIDGTFWSDDELARRGVGTATAREMAHLPVEQSLAPLALSPSPRKLLVHVNNTNPLLLDDSLERSIVEAAGIAVAFDGMELDLP